MCVCPELIEETGRFRKLIFWYTRVTSVPPQQVPTRNSHFPEGVKIHINPYKNYETFIFVYQGYRWTSYHHNAYSLSIDDVVIIFHIVKMITKAAQSLLNHD